MRRGFRAESGSSATRAERSGHLQCSSTAMRKLVSSACGLSGVELGSLALGSLVFWGFAAVVDVR